MFSPTHAGVSPRRWLLAGAAGLVLLAVPFFGLAQATRPATSRPDRSPADLRREYQERFKSLRADDVQAHYALAEWCRDQRQYRSLFRQAQYLLQLQPDHENARLLYRLAVDQLRAQNAQTRPAEGDGQTGSADGELLTPKQIQKLKFAEFLNPDQIRPPLPINGRAIEGLREEFLKVRFDGNVLNEFLDQMSGHQDFSSRADRTRFLSLPPTRQVQLIREYTGEKYQNRIEIINDPLVFRQFDRVLPMIMNGCGTTQCHGGGEAEGWRLRTVRPRTDLNLYTNYLILNRVRKDNQRVINRPKPEESLLLQYGLPPQQAMYQHPEPIPVMFPKGWEDARYRTILAWIQNLPMPEPKIGVALPGYPEPPPPQFGTPNAIKPD
jgi:hypothetical protein